MDVICCDLRGDRVKCTHYRVSSFSHVTFTLFQLHTLSRTVFSLCTRSHNCLSLSVQKDNFTPHTAFFLGSSQHSELRTNVLCFRKVLVSREGAQLQLNTANTRTVRSISPLHQNYPATLLGILGKVNSCFNLKLTKRIGVSDKCIRGLTDCN